MLDVGLGDIRAHDIYATSRFYFEPASNWGTEPNMSMRPDGTPDRRFWYFRRDNWNLNNLSGGGVGVAPGPSLSESLRRAAEGRGPRDPRRAGSHRPAAGRALHLERRRPAAPVSGHRGNDDGRPDATQEENEQLWEELRQQRYQQLRGRRIGLLAQDVEQVAPELVWTDDQGIKSIDYSLGTAVLVEAVKEQQSLIHAFYVRIATIERGA